MEEYTSFLKCSDKNCEYRAEYACFCEFPGFYLCLNHIHSGTGHSSIGMFRPISAYDKERIRTLSWKCINDCFVLENKILKDCREYIEKMTKVTIGIVENVRKLREIYSSVITLVSKSDMVRVVGELKLEEKVIGAQAGNLDINSPYWKVPKLELDVSFKVEESGFEVGKYFEEQNQTPLITVVKNGTKRISCFNVSTFDTFAFNANNLESFSINGGQCNLPDGLFFICCGNNSNSTTPYIINPKARTCSKRKVHNVLYNNITISSYLSECIYNFGGNRNNANNSCDRYNLKKDEWTELSVMPSVINYINTVVFEGKIYICGNGTNEIYKFDTETDKYESVYNTAPQNNPNYRYGFGNQQSLFKVICSAVNKLYVFDNNSLHEFDSKTWKNINSNTGLNGGLYALSCSVRDGESLYFLLNDNYIYKFDFTTQTIQRFEQFQV